ncbi:major facilitator transporter-like protein [Favolaschia claudopus]|uniref:Major facilitator transporter-like protein n=1 Tax=Favolaschia claudopus TaxID=2862362 RepID=A0AAW0CIJ9_9AGAR
MSTSSAPPTSQDEKTPKPQVHEGTILTGRRLAVVFFAMMLGILLLALDQTILATALPHIASEFDSFTLQGWVATSFVLAQTIFLPFWGQLLRIFSAKWALLFCIAVFELGSLICGVSRNIDMLIAGRIISGVGAAGIYVSNQQVITQATRLEDRPRLFSWFGVVFAVSTVIGPLIGGAFTDNVSWRWCFFVNLPVGGVTVITVFFLLKATPPMGADLSKRSRRDILEQFLRVDFIGAILVAGAVTCLILALQWGGNTKAWSDKAVIITFVFAGVLSIVFVLWEIRLQDRAMIPTAIFKSSETYAIVTYAFLTRFSNLLFSYYIPIFYQAARGKSPINSGILLLPFMISVVVTVIIVGQLVSRLGYYWHPLACGPFFLGTGSGLLFTITPSTSPSKLIGYQILAGVGTGMGMQNTVIAMQTEFRSMPALIAQASAVNTFAQYLGGSIGLGIAEPVFASALGSFLAKYAPEAPADVVKEDPTSIWAAGVLPPDQVSGVVRSYTEALREVFLIGVPVAGVALIAAMFIKNVKIVRRKGHGAVENTKQREEEEKQKQEETKPQERIEEV